MSLPFAPWAKLPVAAKWTVLILLSTLFTVLLTWVRLPAALLLGAMVGGVLMENAGAGIRVPKVPFELAQAVIGCMVARSLTPAILHSFLRQWPVFLGVGLLIILVSCLLGWGISKLRILPETTAIWGLLPGAASVMMIMADAYGADSRLVAFMQYLRVVMVAVVASVIARLWIHPALAATVGPVLWFAPIHWLPFSETLVIILIGIALGRASHMAAGMVMVPLVVGTVLQASGLIQIELPRWLLAAAYAFLGWNVGLRFTRETLRYAFHALPQIVLSIFVLILFCGGLAFVLVGALGTDPLTAYLATSPGGVDSVVIIAASTKVNLGFIMALQTSRFLLVLMIGPILSRFVADRITRNIKRTPEQSTVPVP